MANPSKDKGTKAETAVVRYLHRIGYTDARRLPLGGTEDIGDVELGYAGVMFQVKGGKAAEQASDQQIQYWLSQSQVQAVNGGYEWPLLVTKRKGKGAGSVGSWWLHWWQGSVPARTLLLYLPVLIEEELI